MPVMNGLELCRKIKQINKEQDIILISAHSESNELLELINIGISSFILKPINLDLLVERLCISSKNIYSRKMMHYHYEQMKDQLLHGSEISEEDIFNTDALTSLYNHKYFLETINNAHEILHYAILLNINDFKLINDYYSYAHGNHLLFQVAQFLKECASELGYTLFKLSGDEFILLKQGEEGSCMRMAHDVIYIQKVLEKKRYSIVGANDIAINTTAALAKSDGKLLESLHQTLRYAKTYGLKYALYKDIPDTTLDMKNIIQVKNMLQNSIENSTIIPVYQPILMRDGFLKYEMLMRIRDPHGSDALIQPGVFLDIAKRHSYYNEISEIVIFKAIEQLHLHNYNISINFSYADMNNDEFLTKIENILVEKRLAYRLIFEIVETEHLDNMSTTLAFIRRFKSLGVQIAIDDFGSGYSNFAYMVTLEPDFIKIDGSLVCKVLQDEKVALMLAMIIEIAHKLGILVIAEHISSKELADKLQELGADGLQGFFIGRPEEKMR